MKKKSNRIEFTTSWCVQDVRNELAKEVADMTDEEIYEELERLYKRFKENAMESGWDVIDSCFDTKPKEKEVVCDICDGKGYLTDVYDTEAEETQTQRCDSCKQFESDKQAQEHVESEVAL